jgi:dethiobiotin synthase
MGQVIFVTGTDTGVGKTLLTALLVRHLRASGSHALAMKPFCAGGLEDVETLWQSIGGAIPRKLLNPFYCREPLAPLISMRRARHNVALNEVLSSVRRLAAECELLLVEGAGGLLVPLGESYTVADLVHALRCPVLLVAANRLGAINHTLLSLRLLRELPVSQVQIVLMDRSRSNLLTRTNEAIIEEMAAPARVSRVPFLGADVMQNGSLKRVEKKLKKTLARILQDAILSASSMKSAGKKGAKTMENACAIREGR